MSATTSVPRTSIVLAGGGARGAYEAGVLSYMFERIYPELGEDFEFDIASGTSVGAIHAAYLAASSHLRGEERSARLLETWTGMSFADVFKFSTADLVMVPLRAMGLASRRRSDGSPGNDVLGGLVNVSPVKSLVADRIPWASMSANLASGRPGALCVACTEVRTGRVTVFMDGPLADTAAWTNDRNAQAIVAAVTQRHVRASAAIPFLFPAVGIEGSHYLDGGLRANTPLSPAVRLRSNKILVVALRHPAKPGDPDYAVNEEVITQPTFLLGKLLNILTMDQLEQELRQLDMLNTVLGSAMEEFGEEGVERIKTAVRKKRGVAYRPVATEVLHPSEDIGVIAAQCYHGRGTSAGSRSAIGSLLTRTLVTGSPEEEADLLSYLYFDKEFTRPLIELGREDAKRHEERIYRLLVEEED